MLSIIKKKSATKPAAPKAEEEEVVEGDHPNSSEAEETEAEPEPAPKKVTKAAPTKAASKPAPAPAKGESKTKGLGLLKRGKEANEARKKEEVKSELAMKDKLFRFFMERDESGQITFLDGDIVDGSFDNPCTYEHFVNIAGKGRNFLCLQENESCPICEGNNRYGFVTYFTVIDHREYKSKKEAGKVYKDQRRLFVAKRGTVKLLLKIAQKRGGLRGCTLDVSRSTDKNAPNVGDFFDFDSKMTEAELREKYSKRKRQIGEKVEVVDDSVPFDYEKMIEDMFVPAKDLRAMGFGTMSVGHEDAPEGTPEDFEEKV